MAPGLEFLETLLLPFWLWWLGTWEPLSHTQSQTPCANNCSSNGHFLRKYLNWTPYINSEIWLNSEPWKTFSSWECSKEHHFSTSFIFFHYSLGHPPPGNHHTGNKVTQTVPTPFVSQHKYSGMKMRRCHFSVEELKCPHKTRGTASWLWRFTAIWLHCRIQFYFPVRCITVCYFLLSNASWFCLNYSASFQFFSKPHHIFKASPKSKAPLDYFSHCPLNRSAKPSLCLGRANSKQAVSWDNRSKVMCVFLIVFFKK